MKRQLSYDSADMSSWSADNAERLQYYLRFLEGNSSENGPENGSGDSTQNFFLMEEIKNLKKNNLKKDKEIQDLKRLIEESLKRQEAQALKEELITKKFELDQIKSESLRIRQAFEEELEKLQSENQIIRKSLEEVVTEKKSLEEVVTEKDSIVTEKNEICKRLSNLHDQDKKLIEVRSDHIKTLENQLDISKRQSQVATQDFQAEFLQIRDEANMLKVKCLKNETLKSDFKLLKKAYFEMSDKYQTAENDLRRSQEVIRLIENDLANVQVDLEWKNRLNRELQFLVESQRFSIQERDQRIANVSGSSSQLTVQIPQSEAVQSTNRTEDKQEAVKHEKEKLKLEAMIKKLEKDNRELKKDLKSNRDEIIDTMRGIVQKTRYELELKNQANKSLLYEIDSLKEELSKQNSVVPEEISMENAVVPEEISKENVRPEEILWSIDDVKNLHEDISHPEDDDEVSAFLELKRASAETIPSYQLDQCTEIDSEFKFLDDYTQVDDKETMTESRTFENVDVVEAAESTKKTVQHLKHLLEDSSYNTECLREENEDLKKQLEKMHEIEDNGATLKLENQKLKNELQILKDQFADIESVTEEIEQERGVSFNLEGEISEIQKELYGKTTEILYLAKPDELSLISQELAAEISKTEIMKKEYDNVKMELEKYQNLQLKYDELQEQLTREILRIEGMQVEYDGMKMELNRLRKIEVQLKDETEMRKSYEGEFGKILEEFQKIQNQKEKLLSEVKSKDSENEKLHSIIQQLTAEFTQVLHRPKGVKPPEEICHLLNEMKIIIEEVHKDEIDALKSNYDKLLKSMQYENKKLQNLIDEKCNVKCCKSLKGLCEKISACGMEALNYHELFFIHDQIYKCLKPLNTAVFSSEENLDKNGDEKPAGLTEVKSDKNLKNAKILKKKKSDQESCQSPNHCQCSKCASKPKRETFTKPVKSRKLIGGK